MGSSFENLLAALSTPGAEFPQADLTFLSDLDAAQLERLHRVWPSLEADRRDEILREIGNLAQEHIELNFDRVDRMALTDSDARVRRRAIENLWESEDPGLVEPLLEILRSDPDAATRASAAGALGLFVYLGEVERLPQGLLAQIDNQLFLSLRDADETIRLRSLESLGFSSRPEVAGFIRESYASERENARRAALVAMARSADDAWAPQVQAELRSRSPGLRLEAARSAGELELRTSAGDLIDLLDDADLAVRRAAIWSLGQIGGTRSAQVLVRLLDEADAEEAPLIEDALDQLAFVEGTGSFSLLDLDKDTDEEDESP
jgi:HEAT repeat protein